jgi:hypothetical protein
MKILVKFPTRERKESFEFILETSLAFLSNPEDVDFLITLDDDDLIMSDIDSKMKWCVDTFGVNIQVEYGKSNNKIHAINRGLANYKYHWDILVLLSDDMVPIQQDWDKIIKDDMNKFFPDLDGVLHYFDGYRMDLNTLPILGRTYYNRFNYIYNPIYESFFCDDEFMRTAKLLGKHITQNKILFIHDHPVWTGKGNDDLYKRNDEPWKRDELTFNKRKDENFGVV